MRSPLKGAAWTEAEEWVLSLSGRGQESSFAGRVYAGSTLSVPPLPCSTLPAHRWRCPQRCFHTGRPAQFRRGGGSVRRHRRQPGPRQCPLGSFVQLRPATPNQHCQPPHRVARAHIQCACRLQGWHGGATAVCGVVLHAAVLWLVQAQPPCFTPHLPQAGWQWAVPPPPPACHSLGHFELSCD